MLDFGYWMLDNRLPGVAGGEAWMLDDRLNG